MIRINFIAPYISADGFGHATEQIIKEFLKRPLDARLIISNSFLQYTDLDIIDPEVKEQLEYARVKKGTPERGDLTLNFFPPFRPWVNFDNPMVGYVMWETSRIPPARYGWLASMNRAQLVLTPCSHNKRVFKNCGVWKPIEVVPLGVEKGRCRYAPRSGSKFIFGYMASSALDDERKNLNAVVSAYKAVRGEDTELWIKSRYSWHDNPFRGENDIKVIIGAHPKQQLYNGFFDQVHCFVFPTRGEGFGLPPVEAMARGCVTITTGGVGADCLQPPHCLNVASRQIPVSHFGDFEYVEHVMASEIGTWCDPDLDDLTDKMRRVYCDWADHGFSDGEKMGRAAVEYIRENVTYEQTVDQLIRTLRNVASRGWKGDGFSEEEKGREEQMKYPASTVEVAG